MPKPLYIISVDIECDGHIPGDHSMISLGACIVGDTSNNFYSEICPITNNFISEALAISGLDRDRLVNEAPSAREVMIKFTDWTNEFRKNGTVLFLAAPTSFDAMFLNYYFHKFAGSGKGKSTFGIGNFIDMKSYWYGKSSCQWKDTSKRKLRDIFGLKELYHSHMALDDAIEQAIYFENMMKYDNVLVEFIMGLLQKTDRKTVVYRKGSKTQSAATMLHEFRSKSLISQEFLENIKDGISKILSFDVRKNLIKSDDNSDGMK